MDPAGKDGMSVIDPLALGLGTAAGMAVGAAWFARPVFGTAWRRLAGVGEAGPARPGLVYGGALVATAGFAAAIAIGTAAASRGFDLPVPVAAFAAAGVLWAGVAVARSAVSGLFEGRSPRLFLIHVGHDLAVAAVIAAIIGLVGR